MQDILDYFGIGTIIHTLQEVQWSESPVYGGFFVCGICFILGGSHSLKFALYLIDMAWGREKHNKFVTLNNNNISA